MICSEHFKQHPNEVIDRRRDFRVAEMAVTVLAHRTSHPRSRQAQSPRLASIAQLPEHLQAVAPSALAVRRVGAGAGGPLYFVAVIRHEPPRSLTAHLGVAPASALTISSQMPMDFPFSDHDQITVRFDSYVVQTLECVALIFAK